MGTIRMGVIGLGGISKTHIQGTVRSADAELTAVCDIDPAKLEEVGDRLGIPKARRYQDYRHLLEDGQVDATSICTPNGSHFPIALAAARQRIPFLLEKPVTINVDEASQLRDACRSQQVRNMVAFSYRFQPAARYARWLIAEGQLGQIRHCYGQYLQAWAIDHDAMAWRFSKAMSGSGVLADLGSHLIDLARFLVSDIEEVMATTDTIVAQRRWPETQQLDRVDVDDYCHFVAKMGGDVSAVFATSRFAYGRGNYQRVEVYGDQGALVYALDQPDILEVCIGQPYADAHQFQGLRVPSRFYTTQMQSFFDYLKTGDLGWSADLEDGWINQATIEAVLASADRHEWVRVARDP